MSRVLLHAASPSSLARVAVLHSNDLQIGASVSEGSTTHILLSHELLFLLSLAKLPLNIASSVRLPWNTTTAFPAVYKKFSDFVVCAVASCFRFRELTDGFMLNMNLFIS
ncbi:hypothetical protein BS50DRAFT_641666 [Corynespora cassiicola Philippines]|uniref:Uncharacterized protein n=1 Tax=Corynespora cassiicola Philippines TaxID=1448308 RepID=A0A2T2MZ95_CORCC|nr:hypothetical protein BS50DRAFT_641666 [Corynespora cassiicola Philippines]